MKAYMDRRVTPLNRVTLPTWGPTPLRKQALRVRAAGNHEPLALPLRLSSVVSISLRTENVKPNQKSQRQPPAMQAIDSCVAVADIHLQAKILIWLEIRVSQNLAKLGG